MKKILSFLLFALFAHSAFAQLTIADTTKLTVFDPTKSWYPPMSALKTYMFTGKGTLPAGGSDTQVLAKASGADYDVEWVSGGGGGGGVATVTGSGVDNTDAANPVVNARPYKVYTAIMTQSGTDAPVANVLENTLGGTVVWTRLDAGSYIGTLTGAFVENKTTPSTQFNIVDDNPKVAYAYRNPSGSDNTYSYNTRTFDGTPEDNVLQGDFILEIRVYP